VSGVPRYSRSGRYIGSIGMCYDVTDRKLLERELDRRERAEPADEPFGRRLEDDLDRRRPVAVGYGRAGQPDREEPVPGLDRLSRREFEVVRLLLHGDRVPVIARQLFVSQSTVRNHLSSVFRKLRVRSQQELIVLLRERRITG
jgi:DNA-binding CsgD family transcriptional regulator